MTNSKIKSLKEIAIISEQLKQRGKIVVSTNGSFDLIHVGHIDLLEKAKAQGDVLIVGLNSDISVKSYKGLTRPIFQQEHRSRILTALSCVDYLGIYDEPTCLNFVEAVKPNIHANDQAYGYDCIEAPIVKKYGGIIYLVPREIKISTSDIIKKIKEIK